MSGRGAQPGPKPPFWLFSLLATRQEAQPAAGTPGGILDLLAAISAAEKHFQFTAL